VRLARQKADKPRLSYRTIALAVLWNKSTAVQACLAVSVWLSSVSGICLARAISVGEGSEV